MPSEIDRKVEVSRERAMRLLAEGDPDGAFDELAYALRERGCADDLRSVGLGVRLRMTGRLDRAENLRRFLSTMGQER
jgi:hypothetical protein